MRPFLAEFDVPLHEVERTWLRRFATVTLTGFLLCIAVPVGAVWGAVTVARDVMIEARIAWRGTYE